MPHPFFKYATSGVPSRIGSGIWGRVKKYAHSVWQVDSENGMPIINRLKGEANDPGSLAGQNDNLSNGQVVLLFLGGNKIQASVRSVDGDNISLTVDNEIVVVPRDWVKPI
jgi:hypothetical protein